MSKGLRNLSCATGRIDPQAAHSFIFPAIALFTALMVISIHHGLAAQSEPVHDPPQGYTVYVAPHSHIDIVWYWTYDKTRVITIRILRQALEMLKKDRRYAFTQDQMTALQPFWESLSESDKDFLRRMVKEGRFELTTGMYVQPEIAEPDFESLTRQFLAAKPWMENTFGARVLTAWNIDTYGQTVQMPQLFCRAGLKYFVFMRDAPPSLEASVKSPFYWQSPDGSKILSYWLSGSYDIRWKGISQSFERFIRHNVEGNDKIFVLWGTDLYFPSETTAQIEDKIRAAAAEIHVPIKTVVFCTPRQYFQDIEQSGISLPTYTYDFNPPLFIQDLRGTYGQRPNTKLANRKAEDMLESAEKFSTVTSFYGQSYPSEDFDGAWEKILFNEDHDALPGSHIDAVDEVMMSGYGGAIETARAAQDQNLYRISRLINTSEGGDFPFLVFNTLSFQRSEVVGYAPLFKEEIRNFRLLDDKGRPVPFRMLNVSRRNENDPLSMAAIEFVAEDLPALGYRLYRIEPIEGKAQSSEWHPATDEVSNPFFVLRLNLATGSIAGLTDRRSGAELLDTTRYGGNELVLEEEKDPDAEGMVHLTGTEIRGSQFPPDAITEIHDDVGTRVRIQGPFLTGRRTQEITLYNKIPRIDFRTELLGFPGHDGMLTAVFPLQHGDDIKFLYETHNAVTQRPDGIYDAETWVDAENLLGGIALINKGTGGHLIEKGTLKLILLRSITNYNGYYCPRAAEAGSHTFEYSIYPHAGHWDAGGVVEQAHSFNSPLRVSATDAHEGSLAPQMGFVSIAGHFEVTALKKARQGSDFILRGHESVGQYGKATIKLEMPFKRAWLADFLEQPVQPIAIRNGSIEIDCRPFEFVTLRLSPNP
jgi:alpha-mannosidase